MNNYFKKNTQSISKLWAINTITNNIGKIVETKDKIYCIVNKNKIKDVRVKNIILEQMKKYKEEEVLKAVEDVVNILMKVKDGILKFYIENGYIYCENTKSQERVVVSTIDKKGGVNNGRRK